MYAYIIQAYFLDAKKWPATFDRFYRKATLEREVPHGLRSKTDAFRLFINVLLLGRLSKFRSHPDIFSHAPGESILSRRSFVTPRSTVTILRNQCFLSVSVSLSLSLSLCLSTKKKKYRTNEKNWKRKKEKKERIWRTFVRSWFNFLWPRRDERLIISHSTRNDPPCENDSLSRKKKKKKGRNKRNEGWPEWPIFSLFRWSSYLSRW